MKLTDSIISLNDVRLYAYHGVLEQERRVGGEYSVTLRVHYNIGRAMETDDVADTLNYAQLLEIVKREMAVPSNLLEHVAGRIGTAVFLEYPQTEAIDVIVTKMNPPMGADCAGASVCVHLINDKTQL